jgi:hypothetical protein
MHDLSACFASALTSARWGRQILHDHRAPWSPSTWPPC